MNLTSILLGLFLLVAMELGCAKAPDATTCADASANFQALLEKELAKDKRDGESESRALKAKELSLALTAQCTQQNWPKHRITCLAKAQSTSEILECPSPTQDPEY